MEKSYSLLHPGSAALTTQVGMHLPNRDTLTSVQQGISPSLSPPSSKHFSNTAMQEAQLPLEEHFFYDCSDNWHWSVCTCICVCMCVCLGAHLDFRGSNFICLGFYWHLDSVQLMDCRKVFASSPKRITSSLLAQRNLPPNSFSGKHPLWTHGHLQQRQLRTNEPKPTAWV